MNCILKEYLYRDSHRYPESRSFGTAGPRSRCFGTGFRM